MISAGDFRNGVTIELEGNIYQIIEFQHVKPGKGAAFVRTKLKNIVSGGVVEKTFRPTEKCPTAHIDRKDMQYLYSDDDFYHFMDVETYDQIDLTKDSVGDALKFDISLIARSYGNACMLRSFQGFRSKKDIYFYEEEVQVSNDGMVLCKKSLDDLLKVVEQNNHMEIRAAVDRFYGEMSQRGLRGESMTLNINYLLFQLIHLASEQDDEVNQEEILRLISESSFETGTMRGSKTHLMRFACEYGDYLSQLRKNVSRGVLGNVEKEIKEHYADKLTLKGLSEKYYVNSAYLGQLFRKKYGQSFKDYLNNYRMDQAVDLLLHSDKKIIQVAEEVGYHDLDYFVNRFIQVKGCTPAKFRKQMQQ